MLLDDGFADWAQATVVEGVSAGDTGRASGWVCHGSRMSLDARKGNQAVSLIPHEVKP